MKNLIKKILRKNGIIIKRYPETDIVRRMKLVRRKKLTPFWILVQTQDNTQA